MLFSGSNALNLTTDKETARRSLKREVNPLTFSEYLNLKYYCEFPQDMENVLAKMFLTGDIEEMVEIEKKFQTNTVLGLKRDINKEWEDYIQLGGFPRTFKKNLVDAIDYTLEAKDKIVEKDIPRIVSLNTSTIDDTHPLLNNIALERPGTLSEEKMSNKLDLPKSEVHNLLKILEKTLIIFHVEPKGSVTKKTRSSYEYYYLSTQMKSSIYQTDGESTEENKEYWGLMLENFVAFSLFRLPRKTMYKYSIYFDDRRGGVDFLINTRKCKIIPVEVGIGKKNKKQILSAIKHYKADYGIIISNATTSIKKEGNVIFIPYVTFSLF